MFILTLFETHIRTPARLEETRMRARDAWQLEWIGYGHRKPNPKSGTRKR